MTLEIYQTTRSFPREERYGLTTQLRRGASSIAANIAEGCGRRSDAEFGRFLVIAMGSASELEYHLLLAKDLGILKVGVFFRLSETATQVKRMLSSLILKLMADS
jgi:four helix bundle protein